MTYYNTRDKTFRYRSFHGDGSACFSLTGQYKNYRSGSAERYQTSTYDKKHIRVFSSWYWKALQYKEIISIKFDRDLESIIHE